MLLARGRDRALVRKGVGGASGEKESSYGLGGVTAAQLPMETGAPKAGRLAPAYILC